MAAADLDNDMSVQHVDVRLYFPAEIPEPDLLDRISQAVQDSPYLCGMISAYQLTGGTAGELPLA